MSSSSSEASIGRGAVVSSLENWRFSEATKMACFQGAYRTTFVWDGTQIVPEGDPKQFFGYRGVVEGNAIKFFFLEESRDVPFYTFRYYPEGNGPQGSAFFCESIYYKSPIHWKWGSAESNPILSVVEGSGSDHPGKCGNLTDTFEIQGTTPVILGFFVAMFTRSVALLEGLIELRKRQYKRCNVFTLKADATPKLCFSCAQRHGNACVVCSSGLDATPIKGRLCKTCVMARMCCSKCGENCGKSFVEGFLCGRCGIGKTAENCCRMKS
eukprot:TRINITY_DN15893_c0_g1_i1.p1 TRINITY_DN15893_c0_g1~~TRINITY_DN15893_c0_g1_i1.p1  ORF type:complete len:284 (-),score=70.33 TRINITY_DN15893_c0_g1_i1:9-815(-)